MSLRDLPIFTAVLESGAEDRVFDALLLAGPGIILVIIFGGRSILTTGITIAYLVFFVAYVLYHGMRD